MKKLISLLLSLFITISVLGQGFFFKSFTFEPEYKAVLNYARYTLGVSPMPGGFYRMEGNRLMIKNLASGAYADADREWVGAGDPAAKSFSFIDWKLSGDNLTEVGGSITYASNGWTGDASTLSLNTHWIPSSEGTNFANSAASVFFHVSSFNAAEDKVVLGVRNVAGTAQIQANIRSSVASPGATRYILNDNTNSDFASSLLTRGVYDIKRVLSTSKNMVRRNLTSSSSSVNFVAKPDAELYLLARNSANTSTVDLHSSATLSYVTVGGISVNSSTKTRDYTNYYRIVQKPLLYVTSVVQDGETTKVVYTTTDASWDSGSVQGFARYENGTPNDPSDDIELYGGTTQSGSDPIMYSVGSFQYSSATTGTKNPSNPIIDVTSYPALDGILPQDVWQVGSTLYWFFSCRIDGEITHDTYVATSSTSSPLTIGTLSPLFDAGPDNDGHFWHGFKFVRNDPDPDSLHAIIHHRATGSSPFTAEVYAIHKNDDLTDFSKWVLAHSDIIAQPANVGSGGNVTAVYNHCWYDSNEGNYKLVYGRFWDERQADAFTLFSTENSTLASMPIGLECLWPTGVVSDLDGGYTSVPYLVFTGTNYGYIYYAARQGGGSSPYIARNVKQFFVRD